MFYTYVSLGCVHCQRGGIDAGLTLLAVEMLIW
jgi:hypothetical protein